MDRNLRLSIISLIVSVAGSLGTFFQIFGERLLWLVLAIAGCSAFLYYLFKELRDITRLVATFGSRWQLIDGRLKIGNTINVALRAKTIQTLLESFQSRFPHKEEYWKTIRDAGRAIGENFASDLRAELLMLREERIVRSGRTEALIKDKLKLWSKYDSSTGMGIFLTEALHYSNDNLLGTISVRNSFLSYDRHTTHPTCAFLEGYIEGVVLHLLDMHVSVKEIACSSSTGEGVCVFELKSSPNQVL